LIALLEGREKEGRTKGQLGCNGLVAIRSFELLRSQLRWLDS
jgi:hypothetical protein